MSYSDLITSQHQDKQKFVAMINVITDPSVDLQTVLNSIFESYDIDLAVKGQLDVDGLWVGLSRYIGQEITGVYFSWDDTDETGWNQGVWKGPFDPSTGLISLPDDSYRKLLKAKIAANHWDGTISGMSVIWNGVFEGSIIIIQDIQNMSYSITIIGQTFSTLDKALLTGGYLPLKPAGIQIDSYFIAFSTNPVFGWDCDYSKGYFGGWDVGEWAVEL